MYLYTLPLRNLFVDTEVHFEEAKVLIRNCKPKDRKCNGLKKKNKGQTMISKALYKKLKIE